MHRETHNPASAIFHRLQAEDALKEATRNKIRLSIANNVRTVWSGRAFLVRLAILGFVLGVLFALLMASRYTSTTRLMPPESDSGSSLAMAAASIAASHGAGNFSDIAGDLLGLKSTSDVFIGILGSRTVQNQIIEQFDLKRVYGVHLMQDARRKLESCAAISIDHKNQIITISVTDKSPQRAQAIAKAYVDELNRLVSELSTSSARRERIFLASRLEQVNQDLESAEKEFSQFASKNSTIDIKEQGRAMVEAAANLQGQLMFSRSELEGLRRVYADSHVRVLAAKARIAELQSQLEKFGGKDQGAALGPDSNAAALYPSIRKLPLLGVKYADLYRRTKVEESLYELLTQEYELAKLQEAREIPTVKVLDPADLPEKKSSPPRLLIAISTMFLAGMGGVVTLVGSRVWKEKDPKDLSKAVATEIWIDLKEKRFLNPVNGASNAPKTTSLDSSRRKVSTFSSLDLNEDSHNGNGSHSSADYGSEKERYEEKS